MTIRDYDTIETHHLPGVAHQTLAGAKDGVAGAEVWRQVMDPGAETPEHQHDREEIVVILQGSGTCTLGGETVTFKADTTLIVPPNTVHKLCNTGTEPVHLIAVFPESPPGVFTPDGERLVLPWS